MYRKTAFSVAIVLFSLVVFAQERTQPQKNQSDKGYTLSVETLEVQLPISVLDREGRPVNGLTKENFQIFEDKVLQTIKTFKHEDIPLSLGLIIDNSGSMRNKRERVNSSALAFVRESNPDDETFIVNFDDSAYLEQDFTGSIGDLIDALDNIDARGETALYDAIYLSAEHAKNGKKDKKALLLITDGEDNVSKYGINKVIEALKQSKVTLYTIALLEENDQRGGLFKKPPSKKAKDDLQKFAEITGGQAFFPFSAKDLDQMYDKVVSEIHAQYTVGYLSTNEKADGTWRKVDVKIGRKDGRDYRVRSRKGYFGPARAASSGIRE